MILRVIHTFGAVIEQLSLTIEIMVKGPKYILMQYYWEMGTYLHSEIDLYVYIHDT